MYEDGQQNGHALVQPRALLHNDTLVLQHFSETDPAVVRFVRAADDAETAVHSCLQVGARAIDLAQVNLDAAVVERKFDSMAQRLSEQLTDTATRVHDTTHALLDSEDGALALALGKWLTDVESTLDHTFDEDSKKSAIGKLERLLEQAKQAQVDAVRRLVDPHDEDGPLAWQRREILKVFKEETAAIKGAVAEVSEKIAVRNAESELLEHTAIKGAAYEDIVHAEVARIVEPFGTSPSPPARYLAPVAARRAMRSSRSTPTRRAARSPGTCSRSRIARSA